MDTLLPSDTLGTRKSLFGLIEKVEEQADGTIRVFGIASSEDLDDQKEIVRGSAIRDAIPAYMRFPALREMHDLKAAGTALELGVGDDNVTRLVAHVVDPVAISKVKNRVYRGFSIGGRITQREPGNPKCITGLVLNEISLVDRPANPQAILDSWKIADIQTDIQGDDGMADAIGTIADTPAGEALAALIQPVQVWDCGVAGHKHTAKTEAAGCMEKRAADGAAAAEDEIRKAEAALNADPVIEPVVSVSEPDPPAAEVVIEPPPPSIAKFDDNHKPKGKKAALRKAMQDFIDSLSAEDTDPADDGSLSKAAQAQVIKLMSNLNKRIDAGHQMHLDAAAMASKRAMGCAVKKSDKKCAGNMCKSVIDAGATDLGAGGREMLTNSNPEQGAGAATNHATQDTRDNAHTSPPNPTGAVPSSPYPGSAKAGGVSDALAIKAAAVSAYLDGQLNELSKGATADWTPYQKLMRIAHDAVKTVTEGNACKADGKPDYLSRSQMDDLRDAHYHFGKGRGLKCDMAAMAAKASVVIEGTATEVKDDEEAEDSTKAGETEDLSKIDALPEAFAKALQTQNDRFTEQSAQTIKAVAGLAEMLGAVSKRVEDIAAQPMAPLTIAKGTVVTEKGGSDANGPSAEEIAAAIATMSPEQRQVAMLKGTFMAGPDPTLTARFGGALRPPQT